MKEVRMSTKQAVGFETLAAGGLGQPPGVEEKLKSERVQEELKTMPGWRLLPSGMALHRAREFFLPGQAAKFAAYAGELAAGQYQRVQLQLAGTRVALTVYGPKGVGGVTAALLGFARQLG
jgi:pterin-4a-carbinolamine dehydratase